MASRNGSSFTETSGARSPEVNAVAAFVATAPYSPASNSARVSSVNNPPLRGASAASVFVIDPVSARTCEAMYSLNSAAGASSEAMSAPSRRMRSCPPTLSASARSTFRRVESSRA